MKHWGGVQNHTHKISVNQLDDVELRPQAEFSGAISLPHFAFCRPKCASMKSVGYETVIIDVSALFVAFVSA